MKVPDMTEYGLMMASTIGMIVSIAYITLKIQGVL